MKTVKILFAFLFTVIFFCAEAAPDGNSQRRHSQRPRRSSSTVRSSRGSISAQEQRSYYNSLRKRENFALDEIQNSQRRLLKDRNKKENKRKQRCRKTIEIRSREIAGTLAAIKDFPFAKNMLTMEQVVFDIHAGKIDFHGLAGESEEKILKEIHKRQRKALEEFQRKRSVIR